MSFSHGSIVQHFKQERDNFVTIDVISRSANLLKTIPCLGEIQHFLTLNTLSKVPILTSECFGNLSFSHGSIVEHFKQESDNFVTINVISKCANLLITIPCLGERRHFHTLNTLTKVRILISKYFGNLNFSNGSIVEHFRQESDNFVTINDIPNYTNLLL